MIFRRDSSSFDFSSLRAFLIRNRNGIECLFLARDFFDIGESVYCYVCFSGRDQERIDCGGERPGIKNIEVARMFAGRYFHP